MFPSAISHERDLRILVAVARIVWREPNREWGGRDRACRLDDRGRYFLWFIGDVHLLLADVAEHAIVMAGQLPPGPHDVIDSGDFVRGRRRERVNEEAPAALRGLFHEDENAAVGDVLVRERHVVVDAFAIEQNASAHEGIVPHHFEKSAHRIRGEALRAPVRLLNKKRDRRSHLNFCGFSDGSSLSQVFGDAFVRVKSLFEAAGFVLLAEILGRESI
jgi:hypothetical protein